MFRFNKFHPIPFFAGNMPIEDPKDNDATFEQQQREEWSAVESTYSGQVTISNNPWNVGGES